jgi:hypothetical protein
VRGVATVGPSGRDVMRSVFERDGMGGAVCFVVWDAGEVVGA